MRSKTEIIALAQRECKSTATTFRGALRAIKSYKIYARALPLPGWEWSRYSISHPHSPLTMRERCAQHLPYDRVTWYARQHRTRFDARMNRLAAEHMAAGRYLADRRRRPVALLDRAQYDALAQEWLVVLDLPARDAKAGYAERKYRTQALALAESYHAHVSKIYTSQYASIAYGPAEQQKEWDRYSKNYKFPCVYTTAGVTVALNDALVPSAHLHPSRGNQITLPLHTDVQYNHPGLLDGDLYARERQVLGATIVTRYSPADKVTGLAVRLPSTREDGKWYWEHGATVAACRAEWERKRQIHAGERQKAALTRRQERKQRLIARLCGRLACTVADARQAGYCTSGIDGFRSRYGIGESATVAQLRQTGDSRVMAIIQIAARRAAEGAR